MKGKLLTMPKSNAQLWSDLFNSFCRDIDKVAAHQKEQQVSDFVSEAEPTASDSAGSRVGLGFDSTARSYRIADKPALVRVSGQHEIHSAYRQAQEVMNLDDLGIGFGSDFIDPRDEEPWSDTQTRLEQMNSIKGR